LAPKNQLLPAARHAYYAYGGDGYKNPLATTATSPTQYIHLSSEYIAEHTDRARRLASCFDSHTRSVVVGSSLMEGKKIDSGAAGFIAAVASWLAWFCSSATTTAAASGDDDAAAAGVAAAAKHFSSVHAVKFC